MPFVSSLKPHCCRILPRQPWEPLHICKRGENRGQTLSPTARERQVWRRHLLRVKLLLPTFGAERAAGFQAGGLCPVKPSGETARQPNETGVLQRGNAGDCLSSCFGFQ